MKLLRQKSLTRFDANNKPYVDLYCCWVHNGHSYAVRVRPNFTRDYELLFSHSVEVPSGEPLEKYID